MRHIFDKAVVFVMVLLVCLLSQAYAKSPPPGTGKADVPANILFMVDTSGSMSAMASSSNTTRYPFDVAIDSQGNVYVVELQYQRIKKFDANGNFVKQWGRYGGRNGQFNSPHKIAIDSNDNVYVSDYGNSRVQKFDTNGTWLQNFSVNYPVALDVDSSGNVYVGAYQRNQVVKFDSSGSEVKRWSSRSPWGLSVRDGNVYVAEFHNHRITKFTTDGVSVGSWYVYYPIDVEATAYGIYVLSLYQHRVYHYSATGRLQRSWGGCCRGNYRLYYPYGLGSDSASNIYVADYHNHAIKTFTPTGSFMSSTGSGNRLDEAKKVIKKLVTDSDLTKGANFGLMDWNSRARMRVNISTSGAAQIYNTVDSLNAGGGTYLDYAMQLAQSYFLGGNSPIKKNASCQKNFLIVISDGHWYDRRASGIAESLYKNNGIQTFVVGFHSAGGSNYVKLAKKGGTYPDSPLYTSNWQHLYTTLATYIRQAIASNLTFTVPFIMPSISADDHLFQSTFTYKKTHQWQGKLSKFKLKSDGSVGSLVWEAGKNLDKKSASTRKIWTVGGHVGLPSGMNNFVTSNKTPLKDLLWEHSGQTPTDAEVENLIKFVRGIDAYDEDADQSTTDERWKLGDIYHSELTVVGKPEAATTDKKTAVNTEAYYRHQNNYEAFKGQQANRKSTVYVGANDGMLHAFDSASGDELWAFIPPAMLPNLRNMISTKANSSVSIYGVDGSPVVKDVFYKNKWITMLIAGMGRGGHSYFALDVTKRTAPKFLFSFSNDPANKQIYYWSASGTRAGHPYGTISSDYDYSKLGEAWSTPSIVLAATSRGVRRKWVAAFGAGFNAGINPNYGSAVYVVDLENEGKVLNRIDLTDNSGGLANSLPSQLTAVTADTTSVADYSGAMLYGADLESKVWKINLTNDGSLYSATNLFDGQGDDNNGRSNFFAVTPSIGTDGKLWLYFGTGDQQKLQHMSGTIQNRIFGLKDNNFPKYKSVSTALIGKMKNTSGKGSICPTDADIGWYINLATNEKVTGKIAIHNESLFVSRYTPNKTNICNPGTNLLSEHGYGCGKAEKETKLGTGILTGAVVYKGEIYIGISGVPSSSSGTPAAGFTQHGNIIIGKPSKSSSTGGTVTQESWRELF